ncbi:GntR family transcriptional regulator [Gluconacetobacter tumulisoli]|uniref:GntR family transcriptional regulator n=1 Tax=Gluconacetobacter tumulisoli TaxID=1286189 RepID=A0A7W4K9F8_9PROT|nr:GntR family transcriptional regulator [Gluconacetobacter tumulisoli]MBB2202789.1 GntR family transcriptional regulator [Gluconacetobacter tumulisoli]
MMRPHATTRGTAAADMPAKERIYESVRRAILVGTYPPGTFIEEERISTQHDVSRTPVREAFHRLHAEQYIELVPRRGAMVKPISLEEFSGLFQARLLVETSVAAIACQQRIKPSAEMRDALHRLQTFSAVDRPEDQVDYLAADWDFHAALISLSGNTILQAMYGALRPHQERVGMTAHPLPEDLEILAREHFAIYDSLQSHDFAACQMWLTRHLGMAGPRGQPSGRV